MGNRLQNVAELRQYSNRKIFAALLTVTIIVIGATVAAALTIFSLLQSNVQSRGIRDHQFMLDSAYLTIQEAESSQRGYLLTGDEKYLPLFNEAILRLPGEISQLKEVPVGISEQADINALIPAMVAKQKVLEQSVSLRQTGQVDAALALEATGDEQRLMVNITRLRTDIDRQETMLLDVKSRTAAAMGMLALYIVIAAAVMTTLISSTVYYLFLKAIEGERALDHAKDEFVSLASHQLRTPATGIKSILSMIVDGDFGTLNKEQDRLLRKALASNEREINIIEELLNIAKADAGRLVLRPAELDVGSLIECIIAEQGPAIKVKQLLLHFSAPDSPLMMVGDEEKLYMAIGNIIDNARKYTPAEGNIEVTLRGRKGNLEIEVTDSGVGIDAGDISRIFDRFHRARGVLSGNVEGTGLGLYLAQRIVELHNGTIEVASKKGQGSRFLMTLPIRRA